jgi:hypothetical protein
MVVFPEVAGSARANEIAASAQQTPAPRPILIVMSRLRPERRSGFDKTTQDERLFARIPARFGIPVWEIAKPRLTFLCG